MWNFIKNIFKHFKTLSFFGGFILDIIFLPKITSPHFIWIGPIDIIVVLLFIMLRQYFKKKLKFKKKEHKNILKNTNQEEKEEKINSVDIIQKNEKKLSKWEKWNNFATYLVSFFLGTFVSHVLVYYFRSSDVIEMWPIFLIIIATILLNEFFSKILPDIILFFVTTTLFLIFNVPIFLNKVNNNTFLISILVSVISITVFTVILQRIYLSFKEFILLILFSVFFPFFLLQLYYINYIPAVPLSLGESDFYSLIKKEEINQNIKYEKQITGRVDEKKLFFWKKYYYDLNTLKYNSGLYFFSSIISPANVSAEITHQYEKYDENKKIWIQTDRINYTISGGREEGYRGYTHITNISSGLWRVKVLADGRFVGVKKIEIK